ncbi:hypothetical protein PUNSTDRAFT_126554 [Punctularia strigosozonata HHB-11173 SS5]|uniref:uncharacterized protein n=1 Tax=Punctularia strigosozonata (strain HHB-11173) TaxID=741275 RepID=UPI00044163C7|nr:uncharacterized protein PUNSTDRAFT_126554 [Punctularia strigosozonata HHB-11173 SS5]EIN08595.1 hypothetical protein PUNSTDRAFT_126554 [Punctularia strigosozonata HHB-11173 SS5]
MATTATAYAPSLAFDYSTNNNNHSYSGSSYDPRGRPSGTDQLTLPSLSFPSPSPSSHLTDDGESNAHTDGADMSWDPYLSTAWPSLPSSSSFSHHSVSGARPPQGQSQIQSQSIPDPAYPSYWTTPSPPSPAGAQTETEEYASFGSSDPSSYSHHHRSYDHDPRSRSHDHTHQSYRHPNAPPSTSSSSPRSTRPPSSASASSSRTLPTAAAFTKSKSKSESVSHRASSSPTRTRTRVKTEPSEHVGGDGLVVFEVPETPGSVFGARNLLDPDRGNEDEDENENERAVTTTTMTTTSDFPLRATQASPAMRKMMGGFRLDPFAMHDGIHSASRLPGQGRRRPLSSSPSSPSSSSSSPPFFPSSPPAPEEEGKEKERKRPGMTMWGEARALEHEPVELEWQAVLAHPDILRPEQEREREREREEGGLDAAGLIRIDEEEGEEEGCREEQEGGGGKKRVEPVHSPEPSIGSTGLLAYPYAYYTAHRPHRHQYQGQRYRPPSTSPLVSTGSAGYDCRGHGRVQPQFEEQQARTYTSAGTYAHSAHGLGQAHVLGARGTGLTVPRRPTHMGADGAAATRLMMTPAQLASSSSSSASSLAGGDAYHHEHGEISGTRYAPQPMQRRQSRPTDYVRSRYPVSAPVPNATTSAGGSPSSWMS